MTSEVAHVEQGDVAIYDPEKGLKKIAVLEAAEKHWERAKDPTKLFEAIKTKMRAQADYVVWRDGVVPSPSERGKLGGRGKKQISELKSALPDADPGDLVAHRWRKRFCTDGAIDAEKIGSAIDEAGKRCRQIVELQQAANFSSESNEWYTPAKYIEAVREVLGDIDLDPASSEQANAAVQARKFFNIADNGLELDWFGRVFMNPPYGKTDEHRSLAAAFCNKALSEFNTGNIEAGIILVNSLHSQTWQAPLYDHAVCFVDHRIHFVSADGEENENPTFQNIFVYLGQDIAKFASVFSRFGYVMRKV